MKMQKIQNDPSDTKTPDTKTPDTKTPDTDKITIKNIARMFGFR